MSNTLRIIGGQWRSRQLRFPTLPGLRPTGDRMRETLFNWLMGQVEYCRCLDAFAGSGALGLESLSRGASHCDFVELNGQASQQIRSNLALLNCQQAKVWQVNCLDFLQQAQQPYQLIFLDPPFGQGLLNPCLERIRQQQLLSRKGVVYAEAEPSHVLPSGWQVIKHKQQGQVQCWLLSLKESTDE